MTHITQYIVKCYKQTTSIIKNIFLSSLTLLRNGFVIDTNIYGYLFLNESEMNDLDTMSNEQTL